MSRNIKDMINNEAVKTFEEGMDHKQHWIDTAVKIRDDFSKEGLTKSADHVDFLIKQFS